MLTIWTTRACPGTGLNRSLCRSRTALEHAVRWRTFFGVLACCAPILTWAGTYNLTTDYQNYWFRTTNRPAGNFTNYFGEGTLTNASTLTYGGHVLGNTNSNLPVAGGFGLPWSSFGHSVQSIQSDLAMGDVIQPPPDADTNLPPANFIAVRVGECTNAYYQSTNDGTFWVPSTRQIIAGQANNITIYWVTTNKSIHVQNLNVDSVPRSRPARLFWTESPYNAPAVSIQGLFAAIHYNDQVFPRTAFTITDDEGNTTTNEAGVWIDEQTQQLRAKNVSGTFILEYYQTGTYKTQVQPLGIEVVQVLEPTVQVVHADVGTRLMPLDTYWAQADSHNGVIPNVTRGLSDTVYVHSKAGPKYNWAFAIKRTYFEPWSLEVYWQHRGIMGVQWPYEVDWYSCDWPAYPQLFVTKDAPGEPVPAFIPAELTGELQPDMDPAFHAKISSSGRSFTTTEPGTCLIKYSSYDDVWFDVVRTVYRTNAYYFDLEPREWPIGEELTPGGDHTYAVGFDGVADYAAISESFLNQQTNWTISFWFKTGDLREAVLYSEGNPSPAFFIKQDFTNLVVSTYNQNKAGYVTSRTWTNAPIQPRRWHYLTLVYSDGSDANGTLRVYLDDAVWTTNGLPRVNFEGEQAAVLGACIRDSGESGFLDVDSFFFGKVDSLRIWTTALSWDQIRAGAETNLVGTTRSLVADYSFNEGIGQIANNAAGDKDATACAGAFWCYGRAVPGTPWSGFPGYIHLAPGEPDNDRYNVDRYAYPDELNPGASSYIFAVNTGQLEVWWAHRSRHEDMPAVYYPSQVVRYTNVWPLAPPQIVIASGLGSSGDSLMPADDALYFNGTSTSLVTASNHPAMDMGAEGRGTVEAWVNANNPGPLQWIVSRHGQYYLGVNNGMAQVYWQVTGGHYSPNIGVVPTNTWTHIAFTFSGYGFARVYVNGQRMSSFKPYPLISQTNQSLVIGRHPAGGNCFVGSVGEVRIWNRALSDEEIAGAWQTKLRGDEPGLVAYYPFVRVADVSVLKDYGPFQLDGTIADASWTGYGRTMRAGPLVLGSPSIYYQNDPNYPGYNPNEEHALVLGGIAYALRDDLNTDSTSKAFVLVDYLDSETAHPMMKTFQVLEANEFYTFNRNVLAGKPILPPMPLAEMPLCTKTFSCTSPSPAWQDRKLGWWAVSAGADGGSAEARMHFYYQMQPSFFFPDPDDQGQYPIGAQVPWLPRSSDHPNDSEAPVPVVYTVTWPDAPLLRLGQTLTKATKGLPEVWGQLSVDVVYEQSTNQAVSRTSVDLFDPVVARGVNLDMAVIDEMLASRLAIRDTASGHYVFPGLSPSLYPRVYYDFERKQLMVAGVYTQPLTGDPYLLLNLLEDFEKGQVTAAAIGIDSKSLWDEAVLNLPSDVTEIVANKPYVHAALGARLADGCGYVTLAFNNSTNQNQVPPALPVSLAVIKVDTNLYTGDLMILLPSDPLAEQLSVRCSADFAGHVGKCNFRWRWADPAGGLIPNDQFLDDWEPYGETDVATGTNEITIAGASPFTLSDHYFAVQYRPVDTNGPSRDNWSDWEYNLAPGWVKRVMNGVNPFFQMLPDMTANPVDTRVTMISQAGGPYEGDVALNMDAVSQAGLIPVYETVFNRAKDFSIRAGLEKNANMNETLLYAASRLHDLYMLLGNEAYADAMDPTIAFPQELSQDTHGGTATSIFPFMNQLPSLLEEELALLRGRDDRLYPVPKDASPVYNRLVWNFTAGISGGEPAYAYNYNIRGNPTNTAGTITAEDAKRLYPQGHGDAWGHYLSAISHYYDLLSYTNFGWQTEPSATLVGNSTTVSTDFFDEQKFVETAAARARTGAEIVRRTFRQQYSENSADLPTSHNDSDPQRAWGIGEWASRTGQATYYDWVVANSLMYYTLTNMTQVEGDDLPPVGIQKIDRVSTPELQEIVASLNEIQTVLDSADTGLNPLGLARNVVPFDIDPTSIDAGKTHFEQVYDRALQAVYNACIAFDQARGATLQLRGQFDSAFELAEGLAKNETDYKNRLIEIYGYPYVDDIGPTGTYPEGYDGPDLINWQIVNLEEFMVNAPTGQVMTVEIYTVGFDPATDWKGNDPSNFSELTNTIPTSNYLGTVSVCMADNGLKVKRPEWTGKRRAEGELQLALSQYIQQWYAFEAKKAEYSRNLYDLEVEIEHRQADYSRLLHEWDERQTYLDRKQTITTTVESLKAAKDIAEASAVAAKGIIDATAEGCPSVIGGTLIGLPFGGTVFAPFKTGAIPTQIATWSAFVAAHLTTLAINGATIAQAEYDHDWEELMADDSFKGQLRWPTEETLVKLRSQTIMRAELLAQVEALSEAAQQLSKLVAEGDRLVMERAQVRSRAAQRIQTARYGDLAFRIFRDDALRRYQQTFNLAARYTHLAAKAYDYETGLLQTDTSRTPGSKFLEDVVRACAVGRFYTWLGTPMAGGTVGEPGLADVLARMKGDWDVVKGRFGFNNPETETGRFSLRTERYRISPASAYDSVWENLLEDCKVADIKEHREFFRYCRPFIDSTNVEPAIVIPFSTCVIAGQNFFGLELAGGDNAYDSSHAATKIRSIGVWFTGYNATNDSSVSGMANEPRVYLVPVGEDVMRSPTRNALQLRHWQVLDQAIPLPYNIGGASIDAPDWQPVIDSLREPLAQIRRFASFRAYHDYGQFDPSETIRNGRLVGRSVWNTRWFLIIPGRTLLADPAEGIERFIHGNVIDEVNRDHNGVKDIKIFFQTYSIPGD